MLCQGFNRSWFVIAAAAVLILGTAPPAASQIRTVDSRRQPTTFPEVVTPAPTATNRVTAAATFHPASASRGDTVTLLVRVRIAPGHYIYALDKSGTRNLPTTLDTEMSGILQPEDRWLGPEPKIKEDGSRTLSGDFLFQRRFRVMRQPAAENWKALTRLEYQVCNEALCWPPATIPLETQLKIRRSR